MLLKMTEEPEDYEGPWPSEGAMTKPTAEQVMQLANEYAHCYSFVGDDTMPIKHRELRAAIEALAAPAAPQQAKPVAWLGINPRSGHTELCDSKPAPSVMRDFRVRPLYLHPPADEVQQAEPVAWAVFDPSGEVVYAALYKIRCVEYADNEYRYGHSAAKHWAVRPVFAHPPAAEVQRLRDAARLALDALTCGYDDDPDGTHRCGRCDSSVDPNSVVRSALRRALEGK